MSPKKIPHFFAMLSLFININMCLLINKTYLHHRGRNSSNSFLFVCVYSRQGFSVPLEPILELALVDQAGFKLTEICLTLSPECWD